LAADFSDKSPVTFLPILRTASNRTALHPGRAFLPGLLFTVLASSALAATAPAPPAHNLQAFARAGQIFLTWTEAETLPGATFNVYVSENPIRDVAQALRVGHHVEPQSAMDWWEDPASFKRNVTPDRSQGFRIRDGGGRLEPSGGLFVHSAGPDASGDRYFAVTHTTADSREHRTVASGVNATPIGTPAAPGLQEPIWQLEGPPPARGAGRGLGLSLVLHGKGGVVTDSEYLVFGDATLGWREGLPFKFSVRVEDDLVVIRPTDRTWMGRTFTDAADAGTPATWSGWYGYNSRIYDRDLMAQGTPTNYTERGLLWILDWVSRHYGTDRNR
jgi:hypothetical protein